MAATFTIHYYPGHFPPTEIDPVTRGRFGAGLLVVLRGKTVLYRCPAWGGPSTPTPDRRGVMATPTPAGVYVLRKPEPHTTSAWDFAGIKWGTKIKDDPTDRTNALYQLPSSVPGKEAWGSIKRDFKLTIDDIRRYHQRLYGTAELPKTWVFNPFGPLAVRFFKDTNGNGILDKGESLAGEMLHTTAESQAQLINGTAVVPGNSHGCVHMTPKDRDALIGMSVLAAGTKLIIHTYEEHYGAGP